MRITPTHATILEGRCKRRLETLPAHRIALLGAGRFTRSLLQTAAADAHFAGAEITAIIDESAGDGPKQLAGIPVVRHAQAAGCDAIVVSTPMHEPAILRRAAAGEFGSTPVIGLHTIEDALELQVDTLLLPEAAWFGLDLPGLLQQAGRSCTIAAATGLPGFDAVETGAFWRSNEGAPADGLSWDGIDLFEFVRGSAACLLGRAAVDPAGDGAVLRRLMDETIRIYESALACFSMPGSPRAVVVANGLLHHQRAVAEAALRCGKEAIAIEASCFPGLCHLESGAAQTGARSAMGREIRDRLEGRALSETRRARTTAYLAGRTPHTEQRTDSASQPEPIDPAALRSALGIDESSRVLLLLGQVCTDTTLVYDAPLINSVPELARLAAGVVERAPGWVLVVKPHPKESTGADPIAGKAYTNGAYDVLKEDPIAAFPHVRIVGPREFNVYALMRLASAGLAINSQSALEMTAMFARPVALAGRAAFSGAGFTWDIAHRSAFVPTLQALLDDPALTSRQHDRALRYVDHAVFEHLIPADVRTPAEACTRANRAIRSLLGAGGRASTTPSADSQVEPKVGLHAQPPKAVSR